MIPEDLPKINTPQKALGREGASAIGGFVTRPFQM
jgi:hypothetical protein